MEGGGLLSDSIERLGVLRPLSLPPDGRARAAGRGREGSKAEYFKRGSLFPASPIFPARGAARTLCPGQGVRSPWAFLPWAQRLINPTLAKEERRGSLLLCVAGV